MLTLSVVSNASLSFSYFFPSKAFSQLVNNASACIFCFFSICLLCLDNCRLMQSVAFPIGKLMYIQQSEINDCFWKWQNDFFKQKLAMLVERSSLYRVIISVTLIIMSQVLRHLFILACCQLVFLFLMWKNFLLVVMWHHVPANWSESHSTLKPMFAQFYEYFIASLIMAK